MGKSIEEFTSEAAKLDTWRRTELIAALRTLDAWAPFRDAYAWTGYAIVKTILEIEQEKFETALEAALQASKEKRRIEICP